MGPGHAGVRGYEIAVELARCGAALKFVGPKPVLGFSRQDIRRRIRRWLVTYGGEVLVTPKGWLEN